MYFTTHLLTGAAVGAAVGQPVAGFATGVLSHALLDAIPHNDYHHVRYAGLDMVLGWTVYLHFVRAFGPAAQLGAFGGFLPDVEVALGHVITSLKPDSHWQNHFPSHSGATPHGSAPSDAGLLVQAATAGISVLLLLLFGARS